MPQKFLKEISTDAQSNSVTLFDQKVRLPADRMPIYFRTEEGSIGLLILSRHTAESAGKAILKWFVR